MDTPFNSNDTLLAFKETGRGGFPFCEGKPLWGAKGAYGNITGYKDYVIKSLSSDADRWAHYFDQEIQILEHLESRRVAQVPQVIWKNQDRCAFGMNYIPVQSLPSFSDQGRTAQQWKHLGESVSQVALSIAGAFGVEEAKRLIQFRFGLTIPLCVISKELDTVSARLAFSEVNRNALKDCMAQYAVRSAARQPVALHADLRASNIRVSEEGCFSGLIDFGLMNYGLPEGAAAVAYEEGASKSFIDGFCNAYTVYGGQPIEYLDVAFNAVATNVSRTFSRVLSDLERAESARLAVRCLERLQQNI